MNELLQNKLERIVLAGDKVDRFQPITNDKLDNIKAKLTDDEIDIFSKWFDKHYISVKAVVDGQDESDYLSQLTDDYTSFDGYTSRDMMDMRVAWISTLFDISLDSKEDVIKE